MFIDLHTHTVFSDGVLIPAESARRAMAAGYTGIAITDHADASNIEHVLKSVLKFKEAHNRLDISFKVLAGVELTHVHPFQIAELAAFARQLGADIVVVHGETITEPVAEGTNRAAIEAGADILAHPGLIDEVDVKLAAERNVLLEISTRRGNAFANGHVAALVRKHGAKLVVNNDFHAPGDYVGKAMAMKVLRGAGLTVEEAERAIQNGIELFEHKLSN